MLTEAGGATRAGTGWATVLSRALMCAIAACSLGGCFYVQAAVGQASLMSRREPIERVVARPATPPALRARLEYASAARRFAVAALALPDNGSYRSYAALGRPYATWNVFAAPEFSVEPKTWCFPIAGCVAYRGYFDERRARDYAAGLARRGYDTYVGPVPAYSTLGHFDDPVLDTMLRYDDSEIAAMIFHELAHQVAYAPSDTNFNEAFATTVELEGMRRWLDSRGAPAQLARFLERRQRQGAVVRLLLETRDELAALYASGADERGRRAGKQASFERLRARYATLTQAWSGGPAWDGLLAGELNNARLVAVAAYEACVPAFEALLARHGGDLGRFYRAVHALARDPKARAGYCH